MQIRASLVPAVAHADVRRRYAHHRRFPMSTFTATSEAAIRAYSVLGHLEHLPRAFAGFALTPPVALSHEVLSRLYSFSQFGRFHFQFVTTPPPEKLDVQVVDTQRWSLFQFLPSLLRRRGGWFANHALQRRAFLAACGFVNVRRPGADAFVRPPDNDHRAVLFGLVWFYSPSAHSANFLRNSRRLFT